jgi:glutathione synthase/RimK-type ligase-like ATP-grasp enzyme
MQDFRHYDIDNTPYLVHQLPDEIQQKCFTMLSALNLSYGAFDLILTPDDKYIFLEINPSGQYGWIETLTGMPITSAICDLLQTRTSKNPA